MVATKMQKKATGENKITIYGSASSEHQMFDQATLRSSKEIFIPRSMDVGVLLLHSFTSTAYEFYDLALYLAGKGYTVYAPTIAGHGTTPDDLAQTTSGDWTASAETAFDTLSHRVKKVFIVGSSLGGNLAFHLANRKGAIVAGVVSLGTPIRLRWQRVFKCCLYSYGWFKRNQKKRRVDYRLSNLNQEQVVYPVYPIPSVREFFSFIKRVTVPTLSYITAPALIIQSIDDRIVNPISAQYLHESLGSLDKRIMWVDSSSHSLTVDDNRGTVYRAIRRFLANAQ